MRCALTAAYADRRCAYIDARRRSDAGIRRARGFFGRLRPADGLERAAAGAADAKARSLNRVNAERSAPLGTEGDPTDALTQEQVENMSPQAVKKNYNRILASMRNWRL